MKNEEIKPLLQQIVTEASQKAYKQLFLLAYNPLFQFAYSIVKSKEDAEEIVSDLFVTIWQKKESILPIDNHRLYFYVSVKNLAFNKIKQNKKSNASFNEEYLIHFKTPFFNPSEILLSAESVSVIMNIINELPPKCKLIFRLIKEDGLKYSEVASLLEISIKTVEAQMAIAVKKISNSLSFQNHFPELHSIISGK